MTKKHFYTASAIALSMAIGSTAYALDVDANGNQISAQSGQSADDSSNISTTGAIAEDSYNGGDTTTKSDNDTYTSTKTDSSQDNDTTTKTDSSQDNDTSTKTDTDTDISKSYNQDNDTKNVKSGNTVASNNGGNTSTKTDNSQDNDTTTKNDNDTTTITKNDNDTTNTTKNDNDTDTKNVASFNTKNDNDTSTKNDNDTSTKDSYNQDNDTTTKTDNDTTNTTKDSYNQDNDTTTKTDSSVHTNVVADQDLKGVIVNIGVKEVVDAGPSGVTTGGNNVSGSSFSAYAGVLNAAWNTGVNSNAQAATNIAAYGNVTFGSASSAPAAAAPQP